MSVLLKESRSPAPCKARTSQAGAPGTAKFVRLHPTPADWGSSPPTAIALISIPLGLLGLLLTFRQLGDLVKFFWAGGGPEPLLHHVVAFAAAVSVMVLASGLWKGRWWAWLATCALALLSLLVMAVAVAIALPRTIDAGALDPLGIWVVGALMSVQSLVVSVLLRRSARAWCKVP